MSAPLYSIAASAAVDPFTWSSATASNADNVSGATTHQVSFAVTEASTGTLYVIALPHGQADEGTNYIIVQNADGTPFEFDLADTKDVVIFEGYFDVVGVYPSSGITGGFNVAACGW